MNPLTRLTRLFWPPTAVRSMDGWVDFGHDGSSQFSGDATHLVPFYAAIRHIVDFLATLPVDSFRTNGEGRDRAPTPALLRRLDEAGDVGVQQWIGQWAYAVAVHGNAVGWVTAVDGFGFPIGVRWLRRQDWAFDETRQMWTIFGEQIPYGNSRVIHSPWIVPSGCRLGVSPMDHFQSFWKAGMSAQEYSDVARGGGLPPAHVKNVEKTIPPEVARAVQARVTASFGSGKPWVTGNDWEMNVTQIPPNQAQFINTLQMTANETAAIYGIDPREIGGTATSSQSYDTDEGRSLNRANNMRPYIVRFEDMVRRMLPDRQYVKLNVDSTIRTDIKTRFEIYQIERAMGTRSINEIRALEDRKPIGPEGDVFVTPPPATQPATRNGDNHDD